MSAAFLDIRDIGLKCRECKFILKNGGHYDNESWYCSFDCRDKGLVRETCEEIEEENGSS